MVVIFTDGSIGNIQALYLLLSRPDVHVDGIVVDAGMCDVSTGVGNVLQLVLLMGRYTVPIYRGTEWTSFIPNSTDLELCSELDIHPLDEEYPPFPDHVDLMNRYIGDAIVLSPFSTVSEWIRNGSITSLTAFEGSTYPGALGYYIYAIDPQAYNYVLDSNIEKTLWSTDMIPQNLSLAVRGILLSNTMLRSISKTVMDIILNGNWTFWDMIIVMNYLGYIH